MAHVGVFCSSPVAKGVRFGPFQGKVVNTSEVRTHRDNSLMWEVNLFLAVGRLAEGGGCRKPWPLPLWETPGLGEGARSGQ